MGQPSSKTISILRLSNKLTQFLSTRSYKKNTVVIQNTLGSQDAGSLDASSTVNLRSNDFAAYNIDFVNGYTAGQVSSSCHTSKKQAKNSIGCCLDGKWQQNRILWLLLQIVPGYSVCQGWMDVLLQLLYRGYAFVSSQ
jgi:hypothetical protein